MGNGPGLSGAPEQPSRVQQRGPSSRSDYPGGANQLRNNRHPGTAASLAVRNTSLRRPISGDLGTNVQKEDNSFGVSLQNDGLAACDLVWSFPTSSRWEGIGVFMLKEQVSAVRDFVASRKADYIIAVLLLPGRSVSPARTRMSIPRSSKAAARFRFISDPALPNGHQHFLESPIRPEKPSAWRNLFDRECGRMRDGLSQLIPKRNAEKDLRETPGISGHMDDGYSALEQKYGKYWKTIGRGAHGTISIFRKPTPHGREVRLVAVKESHQRPGKDSLDDDKQMLIEHGSRLTSDLQHANVVRIFDVFQAEHGTLYEAMEYCVAGDLFSLIQSEWPFEADEANCFFKQLMRGVQYLHGLGIAHCDLKPENLLLTEDGNLKISDFSCSQWLGRPGDGDDGMRLVSGRRGSTPYVAPEEYVDDEFDGRAADVWACGVIYMVIRLGHYCWPSARKEDRYYTAYVEGRRVEAGFEPVESLNPVECRDIVYCLLDPLPTRRLTSSQFLRSEWVRAMQVCHGAGSE